MLVDQELDFIQVQLVYQNNFYQSMIGHDILSLSVLMLGEIKDILIISTPKDISNYKLLLGDGSRFGIKLSYEIQKKPMGLAQAFIIGESFISNDDVCLILGDNLFYGSGFTNLIKESINEVIKNNKSIIFSYSVKNPSQFGIVEFDEENNVLSLEENLKNRRVILQ